MTEKLRVNSRSLEALHLLLWVSVLLLLTPGRIRVVSWLPCIDVPRLHCVHPVAFVLGFAEEEEQENDGFERNLENANEADEHMEAIVPLSHLLLIISWDPKEQPESIDAERD